MNHSLAAHLVESELRLLDPAVRKNQDEVAVLLADSFVEFGASGRAHTRSEILSKLVSECPVAIEAVDFEARDIAPGVVQVTYRTHIAGENALRSSIWVEQEDGWRMAFHQGTKVP